MLSSGCRNRLNRKVTLVMKAFFLSRMVGKTWGMYGSWGESDHMIPTFQNGSSYWWCSRRSKFSNSAFAFLPEGEVYRSPHTPFNPCFKTDLLTCHSCKVSEMKINIMESLLQETRKIILQIGDAAQTEAAQVTATPVLSILLIGSVIHQKGVSDIEMVQRARRFPSARPPSVPWLSSGRVAAGL